MALFRLAFLVLAALLHATVAPAVQPPAAAHGTAPVRTVPLAVGQYRFLVSLYDHEPFVSGNLVRFSVDPAPSGESPALPIGVAAVPVSGTRGSTVAGSIGPHPDIPGGYAGQVRLTAPGAWNLRLSVSGPSGPVYADVPLRATAPAAIPLWLGWTIGLLPIWGLLGFVLVLAWRAWRAGGFDPAAEAYGRGTHRQAPYEGEAYEHEHEKEESVESA